MQTCGIVLALLVLWAGAVKGSTCGRRCENEACTVYRVSNGELTCIIEHGVPGPVKSQFQRLKQYTESRKRVTCGRLSESGKRIFILSSTYHLIYEWHIDSKKIGVLLNFSANELAFDIAYVKSTKQVLIAFRNCVQSRSVQGAVSKNVLYIFRISAIDVDDELNLIIMTKRKSHTVVLARANGRIKKTLILKTLVSDLTLDTNQKLIYLETGASNLLIIDYNGIVKNEIRKISVINLSLDVQKNILYFTDGFQVLARLGEFGATIKLATTVTRSINGILCYENMIYLTHSYALGAVRGSKCTVLNKVKIGSKKSGDGRMFLAD